MSTTDTSLPTTAGVPKRGPGRDMRVEYPIVIDNDYAVWDAFANQYWPAPRDGRLARIPNVVTMNRLPHSVIRTATVGCSKR